MGDSFAAISCSSIHTPLGSAHKLYYPFSPRTRYGVFYERLESGRNLYLGRNCYHMVPTMISHSGSHTLESITTRFVFGYPYYFRCQAFRMPRVVSDKRKISPWCPEVLLVSCNKQDFLFIARHKCEVDSYPTWRASHLTGTPPYDTSGPDHV